MKNELLSSKNEIKFAIEAMTQCGASCVGCFLTPELRQSQDFWTPEKFNQVKNFIKSSINHQQSLKKIDEIAINLGQGDYFQLKEVEIKRVIDFIYDCADGKASAFITASGITNHNRLKEAVDSFYNYSISKGQALLIDFVLDASKMSSERLFKNYADNLNYIRHKFGHVDVNLNINEDTVKNISPQFINKFMIDNELTFLVINIVPAYHNQKPLQKSWDTIINWMKELYSLWDNSYYELNYANSIKTLQLAYNSNENKSDELMLFVNGEIKDTLLKEYVIDNAGNIFFQQAGFGDLPLSTRNGFHSIGHISESFDFSQIEKASNKLCLQIIKSQMKEPCNQCTYRSICAANGMFACKSILNDSNSLFIPSKECPINISSLYSLIESNPDKHTLKRNHEFSGIYAQKGLKNNNLILEDMDYSNKIIKL